MSRFGWYRIMTVILAVSCAGFLVSCASSIDQARTQPHWEQLIRSFRVTVQSIDRTDDTVVEVTYVKDGTFPIERRSLEIQYDSTVVNPFAIFRVQVESCVPSELDDAQHWTLKECAYRRYRPEPSAAMVRPKVSCLLTVRDQIQLKAIGGLARSVLNQ